MRYLAIIISVAMLGGCPSTSEPLSPEAKAEKDAMDALHGRGPTDHLKAPPMPSEDGVSMRILYPPDGAKLLHSMPLVLELVVPDPKLRMQLRPEALYGLMDRTAPARGEIIERDPAAVVVSAQYAYRTLPDSLNNGKRVVTLQYGSQNFSWGPAFSAKRTVEINGPLVRPEVTITEPAESAEGLSRKLKVSFKPPQAFTMSPPGGDLSDLTRGHAAVIVAAGKAATHVSAGSRVSSPEPGKLAACASQPVGALRPGTVRFPSPGAGLAAIKARCIILVGGETSTEMTLEPGEYTLVVQLLDPGSNSLGQQYAASRQIRVK